MKTWISAQWAQLLNIDSSRDLYLIYFRFLQAIALLGLAVQVLFVLPAIFEFSSYVGSGGISSLFFGVALTLPLLSMALAEFGLRAVKKKQFRGIAIGLVWSVCMLPSIGFPVGAFGLYCFLNKQFQEIYLKRPPKIFAELLTALKINFFVKSESEAA